MKKKILVILFLSCLVFNSFAFPFLTSKVSNKGNKGKFAEFKGSKGDDRPLTLEEIIQVLIDKGLIDAGFDGEIPGFDPYTVKGKGSQVFILEGYIIVLTDGEIYISPIKQ